jgi:hypothetical protein
MKTTPDSKTIEALLELKRYNMLYANPEYQRGAVWKPAQKKRLVDSVFRGYPIPLIYLHHISKEVQGAKRDDFEVIDGQQRINALHEYKEGNFKLFEPIADEQEAQFPNFIKALPCPWGGKRFDELSPELQTQMLQTHLPVVLVETNVSDEARDLFIRLQAGMPLNSQEKRDAWPGNFTEFVLRIAGKPELPKYPGNEFFRVVMKAKDKNRGEFRQLAAQMVMLYFRRRETGRLCEISGEALDLFYHKNLDFDSHSADAKRFSEILDTLKTLLGDGKRKKVERHEAISLVLLVDSLLGDYTQSWKESFAAAFDSFRENAAKGAKTKYDEKPDEYWSKYGQLTRSGTDRPDTIERRHLFFVEKMYGALHPQLKDPLRAFGGVEKEIIYYRDGKRCQLPNCGTEVTWDDAEFHHVQMHSHGGPTTMENGALVHKGCHPKGEKAVGDFAVQWRQKMEKRRIESSSAHVIPSATSITVRSESRRAKRGRPKRSREEALIKGFEKAGLTPEKAGEMARMALDSIDAQGSSST